MGTNKRGRKSKYKPEYAKLAYQFCLLGATNDQLAALFKINTDTINGWMKSFPEFSDAVKGSKEQADAQVAEGLFKRGIGFQYDEVTYEKIDLKADAADDIKVEAYKRKVVTKHVIPDPGAAMNWLSNRQPDRWRNKQTIDAKVDWLKTLEKLTEEDLQRLANEILKQQQHG